MTDHDCDVAVIGAGLAGAAAAHEIARGGRKVRILEARDRIGGRAFTRGFSIGGERLEFGGSWITPWHERVRHYAGLAGITLRPTHPVIERRWHDGTNLRSVGPCSAAARSAFDRAMQRIKSDARRYKAGEGAAIAKSTLGEYLDRIEASPEARIHALAWWTISGNGDPHRISAGEFLSSCAYGGGLPEGMMTALAHTLVPGAAVLAERMIERSGAELVLDAEVTKVEESHDAVVVTHKTGRRTRARSAAFCLPLNVIGSIAFSPPLPERKRQAATTGHGGSCFKVWIKARNVKVGTLATGGSDGLRWMFAEREASDGTTLIVAFGLADDGFDPASGHDVAGCLNRFFPEAHLVAWDWHDWMADPYARGTWVALPAAALWIADHTVWSPEHRLAFASSDYAPHSAGWFEAAIVAGEEAARALISRDNALAQIC